MTYSLLDYFLIGQLSTALMIFCRIGSAMMVMPGIGEIYVLSRGRLLLAVAVSILLTPLLQPQMPALSSSVLGVFMQLFAEILVGLFIGFLARIMVLAIHVTGHLIAAQSSLAVASMFDPSSGGQSTVISNMLMLLGVSLFFALDLHHLLLAALVQSYDVFTPGQFPNTEDMNVLNTRVMADSFKVGVMLSAPHLVFSLLFYLAGGLMTRVMPNFQVFFVMMSPQILIALLLLMGILPMMMELFMGYIQEQINHFVLVD